MTSGGANRPVSALEPQTERDFAAVWPRPHPPADRWRSRLASDRYSRRVALLKRLLPAVGMTLLLLVAVWPRLGPLLESVRLGFPAIDLREARELKMVNPRYAGIDRYNRPYVLTSAIGRQVPNRDDLMSLEGPRAEMTMHRGASIVVTAVTAVYQSQTQLLDLFDDVNLVHENGTRFVTQRAHADLSSNTAKGDDPVTGHGPSGDIAAQGFRILEKGDTIIFTGKSDLLLKGTKPSVNPAVPPALPVEVAQAAAQIEAAAGLSNVVAAEPATPSDAVAQPAYPEPAARRAAKFPVAGSRDAKSPTGAASAGARAKRDGT
jgi:lipopolysaccharide export system protein LptC